MERDEDVAGGVGDGWVSNDRSRQASIPVGVESAAVAANVLDYYPVCVALGAGLVDEHLILVREVWYTCYYSRTGRSGEAVSRLVLRLPNNLSIAVLELICYSCPKAQPAGGRCRCELVCVSVIVEDYPEAVIASDLDCCRQF